MTSYGENAIQDILFNDSSITAVLGTFVIGTENKPCLFNGRMIPPHIEETPCINYYKISPVAGGTEYEQYTFSVNCRADTEGASYQLADLVYNALNRVHTNINGKDYFFVVDILPSIPPIDQTDLWNIPVETILRRR